MEKWKTELVPADEANIARAAALLRQGEVVGFPTETVYGLAGDALNPEAVEKIFRAKGRPQDNPLIVHIASMEMLPGLVENPPELAFKLAEAFWPGPMTMVLPKSARIPDVTSAGLSTVGIRFPSNPVAQALIRESGLPIAAPSGNLSGRPSPTAAQHMMEDMDGRIPMILDGGPCAVGVESTVIGVGEDRVRLFRPGGITVEMLEEICPVEIDPGVLHVVEAGRKVASPGMKYRHYAPKADVKIVEGSFDAFRAFIGRQKGEGVFAIVFDGEENALPVHALPFGAEDDPAAQAHLLFDLLRECDERGAKEVYVRSPRTTGIGLAVYNRLLRAAAFQIVHLDESGVAAQ